MHPAPLPIRLGKGKEKEKAKQQLLKAVLVKRVSKPVRKNRKKKEKENARQDANTPSRLISGKFTLYLKKINAMIKSK
jgi:hypothetical protein